MLNDPRYYRIADITLEIKSDQPITNNTFHEKFENFRVKGPDKDTATIHHHFYLPDLDQIDLGKQVYHNPPWSIYKQQDGWLYIGIMPDGFASNIWKIGMFSFDYSENDYYHPPNFNYENSRSPSLTFLPTDQILVASLLNTRNGCYFHSAGAVFNDAGLLFIGHSEAGKTTTTQMLKDAYITNNHFLGKPSVEILCDDRNIVRLSDQGWKIYGSWSHGDIPDVSGSSAPLKAILFLEKHTENKIVPILNKSEVRKHLLPFVIKPLVTADWWDNTLDVIVNLSKQVPCYRMLFDKSGNILTEIEELIAL